MAAAQRSGDPEPDDLTVVFAYDSAYTRDSCDVDVATPLLQKNRTVTALCRRLLQEAAELGVVVTWVKVRGHSTVDLVEATVPGNDRADKAADKGQAGRTRGEQE